MNTDEHKLGAMDVMVKTFKYGYGLCFVNAETQVMNLLEDKYIEEPVSKLYKIM